MIPGRALILGAGQIGAGCADVLRQAGWQVTKARRTAAGGDIGFDRRAPSTLLAAIGCGVDLLLDTIGFDRADADALLPLTTDVGRLVTISSASVYTDPEGRSLDEASVSGFPRFSGPIEEDNATVAAGTETYSTRKVAMEQRLLDAAACPVAVLRPCAIHGLGSRHPREWWFVKRLLDGREVIPLAHLGESRFQTTAVANIAALVAVLAGLRFHGILNIGDPEPPTVADIGQIIAGLLDRPVRIDRRDGPPRGTVGRSPWAVPLPYLISSEASTKLGYRPAGDYGCLVAPMVRWLAEQSGEVDWRRRFPQLAAYPFDLFDYAAEDAA